MEKICDVIIYNDIDKALENARRDHRIYLPKERVLIYFYNSESHYKIFNFKNNLITGLYSKTREPYYLEKDVFLLILNDSFDEETLSKDVYYYKNEFTDKDMMEPIETEEIKDFSAYKDKKLGSLNMIKILRAKNIKVIRRMLLTDDYAFDSGTNFGKGNELDKFNLINSLKRGGTKAYNFHYENEKDISGSCYSFDFFNVVVK